MEVRVKNMNVWEINDSGSISLLVHSYHQKSVSFILYKRVIYTYYYTAQKPRAKSLSGVAEGKGGGSGRLITAINFTFKTCNL